MQWHDGSQSLKLNFQPFVCVCVLLVAKFGNGGRHFYLNFPHILALRLNLSSYINMELHLFITDMSSDPWPKRESAGCQSLCMGCGKFMGMVILSAMYPIFHIGKLIQLLFL